MTKKLLYALILIAILVVVLIFQRGSATVNLLIADVSGMKSIVYLIFTSIGVAIGVLLK